MPRPLKLNHLVGQLLDLQRPLRPPSEPIGGVRRRRRAKLCPTTLIRGNRHSI